MFALTLSASFLLPPAPPPRAKAETAVAAIRNLDSALGRSAGLPVGWVKVTTGSLMIGKPGIGVHTRFTPVAVCCSEKAP